MATRRGGGALGFIAEVGEESRRHLIKLLAVFLSGLLMAILVLRMYLFEKLQRDALRRSSQAGMEVEIAYVNPFEVVLLQAKIGVITGIILCIPFAVYLSRKPLKRRGVWPDVKWQSNKYLALFVLLSVALFISGVAYAYLVMIPFILEFLVLVAVSAEVKPFFRISSFINFVLMYSLIFGLMAQLPLIMLFAVKSGVLTYHFFRSKWKHFVVAGAILSALVTSPDPLTQLIVLGPFVVIYFGGLGLVNLFARKEIRREREIRQKLQDRTESKEEPREDARDEVPMAEKVMSSDNGDAKPQSGNVVGNGGVRDEVLDQGLLSVVKPLIAGAQRHTLKIFGVFLLVTSVAFYWLIFHGIRQIRNQTLSYMSPELRNQVVTVQLEIFEFVFLVVKYSLVIGVLVTLPFLVYFSRDVLKEEGVIQGTGSWLYYGVRFAVVAFLFILGVMYAYLGMMPILVGILSQSIVESGMTASFTINDLVNFVVLISLTFGFMALLPAAMYILVSARIMRFETLRSKWKHFCIASFGFGAIATSPDPFTMMVVAVPLVGFYVISLGITRITCHRTIKRVRAERREIGLPT